MDERQKMQHLFQFDLWCTNTLVDLVTENAPFKEQETCISLLSHIINAQKIWYRRVIKSSTENEVAIWDDHDLEILKSKARKANQKWMDFIADHEVDLNTEIHYQNSNGASFNNTVWEICNHLIIHGQHHRAQISLYLRNCDIKPPAIDYIHFARLSKSAELLN
ncbi:MAG: hypothetical protein GVY07_13345 [Bacteroidetes bacterium]|jgi:uncharacterized damage-inducible protein DinB|nr:hypothetical protein [Bacteroidota bacterium]